MNIQYTSYGVVYEPRIESGFQSGPSISNEERDRRLAILKNMKGKREKTEIQIYEKLKKEGKI